MPADARTDARPGGPRRRLAIDADLDLRIDGHPVAVRGSGGTLRVEVDEARTAWRLFQSHRPGRSLVRAITDTLDVFGVDVDVVVGGRHVARVGADTEPGRLLELLGLPAVELPNPLDGPLGDALDAVPNPLRGLDPSQRTWLLAGLAFVGGLALGARR